MQLRNRPGEIAQI